MVQCEQLVSLIERAGGLIASADKRDAESLDALSEVIEQIQRMLEAVERSQALWDEQIEKATVETLEGLKQVMQQETQNVNHLQVVLQQATQGLMALADQGGIGEAEGETPTEQTDVEPEALCIPEEDVPLVQDFINESSEHIEAAEIGLLELEKAPEDKEVINRIFRAFHTIKGMAGFLNLHDIGSLAHSAENLLDMARKEELTLQGSNMDIIFESMDVMKKMIAMLKDCVQAGQPIAVQTGLADLLERLKVAREQGAAPKAAPVPPVFASNETASPAPETKAAMPVEVSMPAQNDKALEKTLQGGNAEAKAKIKYGKPQANDDKIKVSTTRLDSLIDMVGELVIANLMVAEEVKDKLTSQHELGTKVSHLSKIVRELQELSMSMRMVPIQGVFHRMARLVRDLARKSGKDVQFVTYGDETELDRTVVDKIADPLVHMVRNSVDHGIENAEDREKAGKSSGGKVELRAFHKAGNVIIEIEDDGKGLNKEAIMKKAVENGVIEPNAELSDEEAYKLVFHAGLSTAKQITDISGRGVGMDVVKKNIEALQGRVDIRSEVGKGTVFSICLPLTLAIIDGQIVTVGNERYIVPINSIVNSFRPDPSQISSVQNQGEMVRVRGELMPLIRLYNLFGVREAVSDPQEGLLVIVEADHLRSCILVDDLLGQQQVVIKSLGGGLGSVAGVSGGAIMGDGRVSLILDVPGLIDLSRSR